MSQKKSSDGTAAAAAAASSGGGGGPSWKNPTLQSMQKFGLRPLPDDFEPTAEERLVLDMYQVIKSHEREANRLRQEAAQAKLAAKDEEFKAAAKKKQEAKASDKKKKKKKGKSDNPPTRVPKVDDGMQEEEEEDDDDDEEEDEEEDEDVDAMEEDEDDIGAPEPKRAKTVDDTTTSLQDQTDALRENYLAQNDGDEDIVAPVLKRKNLEEKEPTSSLIANLSAAATPPHDFSKSLGFSAIRGKTLWPVANDTFGETITGEASWWKPPTGVRSPNDGAFTADLEDFDVVQAQNGVGNNTLAIKFMAPSDSKRFSLNIALSEDRHDFESVLFHFNPRQRERGGQLVINDKQEGTWGQALTLPLSQLPMIFGQQSCTLIVQINGEGFDVFIENKHCVRLEHRVELPAGSTQLVLQFPSTDDRGKRENWTVYKVWWGNKPIMAKADLTGVPGVNTYNSVHPRKLFISGLTKIHTQADLDIRRAELERAFRKYGGDRGVNVILSKNVTYAFVEMESEQQAELALAEMQHRYRMNRARRSKHEALQEERAAAEAAKSGKTKEARTWD